MIVTTCIKENRDLKGRIENYVLADMQGNNIILDSNNIKMNISYILCLFKLIVIHLSHGSKSSLNIAISLYVLSKYKAIIYIILYRFFKNRS